MILGIVGYGKMGKEVERLALEKGHSIGFIAKGPEDKWGEADVVIEFSNPKNCQANFNRAFDLNLPIVTGTTGWYDDMESLKRTVENHQYSFLWASNFSIGVNLFFQLNKKLAEMMNGYKDYDCQIDEIHHLEKLDSPSGTGITLATDVISKLDDYSQWINSEKYEPGSLPIVSHREKHVPGTHVVSYQNDIDGIEIKHVAKNRKGFALGAIFAAEWILGRKGFFNIKDAMAL